MDNNQVPCEIRSNFNDGHKCKACDKINTQVQVSKKKQPGYAKFHMVFVIKKMSV